MPTTPEPTDVTLQPLFPKSTAGMTAAGQRLCTAHGGYEAFEIALPSGAKVHSQCPKCHEIYLEAEAERALNAVRASAAGRHQAALIPKRFALKVISDFQVSGAGQKKAHAVAVRYVQRWKDVRKQGTSLVMCGGFGTGKTLLACAILREVIEDGSTGLYATALNAVRRIKETWRQGDLLTETEKQAIAAFVKPDLLVLDEVGVQFGTEAEKLLLFDILNGRYEDVKPTIVISNLDVDGMAAFVGARVMDRLKEGGGYGIVFDWKSYREGGQQ